MPAELLRDASRATDANGNPLSGAKWKFYATGTLTPLAVYADADLAVSLGSTVTADAGGRFVPIYFDANQSYRGRLENAAGTLVSGMDIDPINDGAGPDLSVPEGSGGIGFIQDDDEAVATTALAKMRESVSIGDFGGDGVGVDDDAVTRAEASAFPFIDLVGRTITTTLPGNSLTKSYYNGTLLANNGVSGRFLTVVNASPLADVEISRRRTKTPILDWRGLSGLWLGTSIPAFGFPDGDSYPNIFAKTLGCNVDNLGWAGSHATYDGVAAYAALTTDAERVGHISALSMTEDDRLAGLALYGSSSAYSDTSPIEAINVTKPSMQTADYRIKLQFSATSYDFVVLDHCHNDALQIPGDDDYETLTIGSITKGTDTVIGVSSIGSLAVGDAIILRVTGIAKLDHHACRVQSIAGTNVTISLDSSGFSGSFTSGTIQKVNRATIWGGFEFNIHYILWAAALYDGPVPKIILASPPSAWSDYERCDQMHSTAEVIKDIADKWEFSFFDGLFLYDVKLQDQAVMLPDGTHPSTPATRQAYANLLIAWAQGGTPRTVDPDNFLPTGSDLAGEYLDQQMATYDRLRGGFDTPEVYRAALASVLSDDFADGNFTGWTSVGTGAQLPVVVDAPWGAGKAVSFTGLSSAQSSLVHAVSLDAQVDHSFDIEIPVTAGLVPSGTLGLATIARYDNSLGNVVYEIQIVATPSQASVRMGYYTNPDLTGEAFVPLSDTVLEADTKYKIGFTALKAESGYDGAILFTIDDEEIARLASLPNPTQTTPVSLGIGVTFTSIPSFSIFIGNVVVQAGAALDWTAPYTGDKTVGGDTWTFVGGLLMS